MNVTTLKNSIAAVAVVGLLGFASAPAWAARAIDVQAAVASLKDALADINAATTYFDSDGQPGETSVTVGLSDFTRTLKLKRPDGRKVLEEFIASTRTGQRRALISSILDNLRTTTGGVQQGATLRDAFYYDFVKSIARISGTGRDNVNLQAQLVTLFGRNAAAKLLTRYELAVSRTR
jgi:hypothetical protein